MVWITANFLEQWELPHHNAAAKQLTTHFTPIVVAYGQSYGLPHDVAEDAAQDTMVAFLKALEAKKYDHSKGRMRDLILGIAKYKIKTHLASLLRQRRVGKGVATDIWSTIPDEKAARHTWNTEIRKMEMKWCIEQARRDFKSRPKTFKAFELCFRPDMDTAKVAEELRMSIEAVRVCKHRVLKHIRELIKQLNEYI